MKIADKGEFDADDRDQYDEFVKDPYRHPRDVREHETTAKDCELVSWMAA